MLKARAVPYQPVANLELDQGLLVASMSNRGAATLQFGLYAHHALGDTADRFDVAAGASATGSVAPDALSGAYDVEIHGPNGFLRRAAGSVLAPEAGVEASLALIGGDRNPRLKLSLRNQSGQPQSLSISGLHDDAHRFDLNPGSNTAVDVDPLDDQHGWYDLVVSVRGRPLFTRRFAGHLENGEPSRTSPS
jgi:phospholipase C